MTDEWSSNNFSEVFGRELTRNKRLKLHMQVHLSPTRSASGEGVVVGNKGSG